MFVLERAGRGIFCKGRAGADSKTEAVHKLVATSKAALTGAFSTKVKASVEYERAGGAGVETRWTEPAAFSRTDRMLQYSSSAMAACLQSQKQGRPQQQWPQQLQRHQT